MQSQPPSNEKQTHSMCCSLRWHICGTHGGGLIYGQGRAGARPTAWVDPGSPQVSCPGLHGVRGRRDRIVQAVEQERRDCGLGSMGSGRATYVSARQYADGEETAPGGRNPRQKSCNGGSWFLKQHRPAGGGASGEREQSAPHDRRTRNEREGKRNERRLDRSRLDTSNTRRIETSAEPVPCGSLSVSRCLSGCCCGAVDI